VGEVPTLGHRPRATCDRGSLTTSLAECVAAVPGLRALRVAHGGVATDADAAAVAGTFTSLVLIFIDVCVVEST